MNLEAGKLESPAAHSSMVTPIWRSGTVCTRQVSCRNAGAGGIPPWSRVWRIAGNDPIVTGALAVTHHAPHRTDAQLDAMQQGFNDPSAIFIAREKQAETFDREFSAFAKMQSLKQHRTVFKAGDSAGTSLSPGAWVPWAFFFPATTRREPDFVIGRNYEIFGEMGVIDDELRMADARCLDGL